MYKFLKVLSGVIATIGVFVGAITGTKAINNAIEEQKWQRPCDGTTITSQCSDEDGVRYSKYVFHAAEPEKTKEIYHAAVAAKTHTVYHPAEYGTKTRKECIKTTISYKNGTCALSRCRDGEYSGSSGKGTCSYHGGVWYSGGPWYELIEEKYLVKAAWTETVVDTPAQEAWTETIVVSPAKEAWVDKVVAE